MADYPPANSQYDAWPLVIQFIQISTNYAKSPALNGGFDQIPVKEAARRVWNRWYNPDLWRNADIMITVYSMEKGVNKFTIKAEKAGGPYLFTAHHGEYATTVQLQDSDIEEMMIALVRRPM